MQTSKLRLKLMVGGWTETKKVELWLSREESRREARRDVGCRDATGKSAGGQEGDGGSRGVVLDTTLSTRRVGSCCDRQLGWRSGMEMLG